MRLCLTSIPHLPNLCDVPSHAALALCALFDYNRRALAEWRLKTTMPKRKINHETRRKFARRSRVGNNVSFSQIKTKRLFRTNLQWATIEIDGKPVRVRLTARQIKALCKTK
jgi:ribosomal protein L28